MNDYRQNFPTLFPPSTSGMADVIKYMNNIFTTSNLKKIFPYPMNIYNIIDKETNKTITTVIQLALAGCLKEQIKSAFVKGKHLSISFIPRFDGASDNLFYQQVIVC